ESLSSHFIDFSPVPGSVEGYEVLSTSALFPRVESEVSMQLRGSIVVIGAGYADTEDQHRTPLSTRFMGLGPSIRDKVFGAEVQAYSIATILNAMEMKDGGFFRSSEPAGYIDLPADRIFWSCLGSAMVGG